jgi:large subunit ribosomal protein L25
MNNLKAIKRSTKSSGQINKLRSDGFIPAVIYGGKENNLNISLNKLHLKDIIKTETFMSKVFNLDIDGSPEKVLPREVAYDPVSDEPIHIDFIRIVKGSSIVLEIPVKFINSDKSPGLKKGGVLNIVRRKVELKCPAENIPDEIIVDLDNTEINTSLKISSVKLPEGVTPTITDRDFVIGTVVAPTVLVEPEKPEEATAKTTDEKSTKPGDDKGKAAPADKGKPASKENKKK